MSPEAIEDALEAHEVWLANPFEGNQLELIREDLSLYDFTPFDVTNAKLAHSDIDGTIFGDVVGTNFVFCTGVPVLDGSNISGSTFEKASVGVLNALIGSIWNGVEITTVSGWLTSSGLYWMFKTNAFVQIGCMQKTKAEWEAIGATLGDVTTFANANATLDINAAATYAWWNANKHLLD